MNSFTRAKAVGTAWNIRVDGPTPAPGQEVQVYKQNGALRTVTVGQVLWTGIASDGAPASLCTIGPKSARGSVRRPSKYDGRRNMGRCEDAPCCGHEECGV